VLLLIADLEVDHPPRVVTPTQSARSQTAATST